MLSVKETMLQKTYPIEKFMKEVVPSPRQLLIGQGVRRISGLQNLEVKLEVAMLEVLEQLKKQKRRSMVSTKSKMKGARSSIN